MKWIFTYPDLQKIVRDYLSDSEPMASHRFVSRLSLRQTWQDLVHPGAHHSQMFDGRSLVTMFREVGFVDAQVTGFGESGIPDILKLEMESRRRGTLYVERGKAGDRVRGRMTRIIFRVKN